MKDKAIVSHYSHGLEKIYSYETINPASVRSLNIKKEISPILKEKEEYTNLSLNLFPTTNKLFREKEPLDSLQLSPFALKAIKGLSIETVGQLRQIILHNKPTLRSIGQGHIEEIENKLNLFFTKNTAEGNNQIDLRSCLRLVLSKIAVKEKAILAALFHLKPFCFIPSSEEKEADLFVRRLTQATQEELFQKLSSKMIDSLYETITILSSSFIKPLLERKGGVLSEKTVQLALLSASDTSSYSEINHIQTFFQKILPLKDKPWFTVPFEYVNNQFLCSSPEIASAAEDAIKQAHSLLEITKGKASLQEIALLIWKCQARNWNPLDESAIEELVYWTYCPFTVLPVQ